jgi:hypothetical protein
VRRAERRAPRATEDSNAIRRADPPPPVPRTHPQAVHNKTLDANLLAEFVSCPMLLLP